MTPSSQLRVAVWDSHKRAERHPLMRHLLSSNVRIDAYVAYIKALLPLYTALESALQGVKDPLCAVFSDPVLRRSQRLAADIEALSNGNTSNECGVSSPSSILPALPDGVATPQPISLAAMAYIRYFGDLAGGQAMGLHLKRQLGISALSGGQFFEFRYPEGKDGNHYLKVMRDNLDCELDDPAASRLFIGEAVAGFEWHLSLFDAVWKQIAVDSPVDVD